MLWDSRRGADLHVETEVVKPSDEAVGKLGLIATVEMVGTEIPAVDLAAQGGAGSQTGSSPQVPDSLDVRDVERLPIKSSKLSKLSYYFFMANRMRPVGGEATFLTTREAALRLGVTVNAVKSWIREDHLPALRTPGGHHRIAEVELRAFQSRLVVNPRSARPAAPRILIVDDDARLLTMLRSAVEEAVPDAVVEVARDGYEALVQVGMFRPDVLVLDLRMPRLDGFEVCRRLKARPDTRSIRILAITAYPERDVRAAILACGADAFLEKPFEVDEFRTQVLPLLRDQVGR